MFSRFDGTVITESQSPNQWIVSSTGGQKRAGTARNDIFHSAARDQMAGGLGDDTYYLWSADATVLEQFEQGIDTVVASYWGSATLSDHVENLYLSTPGSTSGTGNELDNLIVAGTAGALLNGLRGDDVLVGGSGADVFKIVAGNGSDAVVNFTPGTDTILLQGYGFTSFSPLQALGVQQGADIRFDFANGEALLVRGVELETLDAADFGLPLELAARAGAGGRELTGPAQVWFANGWSVLNNTWNSAGLEYGTQFSIRSAFNPTDLTGGTSFTWSYPYVTDWSPSIKAYPEVSYGASPYGGGQNNPTDQVLALPVKVSDLLAFTAQHSFSIEGTTSGFNVAYDIFLTSTPNGDHTTITNEIMVWMHKGSFAPMGEVVGTYTDGDFSATIYHTGKYTALVADRDMTHYTLDVAKVIAKLEALGIVTNSEYIASLHFGAEVTSGVGAMTIHNLDLHVESRGADGSTVIKDVRGEGSAVGTDVGVPGKPATVGSDGVDQFYYGAAFTAADANDGGANTDVVVLQGNYVVTMGTASLVDVEYLSLQSGSSTRYGEDGTHSYDYDITFLDANVAAGQRFTVNASQLLAGESFVFNGAAESDGQFLVYAGYGDDDLTGGSGNDMFHFEGTRWGAGDVVDGGAGADALNIRGNGGLLTITFGETQLSSIESITVSDRFALESAGRPSYDLTLANGNVAPGATLILNGSTLLASDQMFDVDGSAVTGGHLRLYGGAGTDHMIGGAGNDLLYAAGGADVLTGGGGADSFQLRSLTDSAADSPDAILDFVSGVDKLDLHFLDADANVAGDQAFTFIGDSAFSHAAGQLRAFDTGLGHWRVEGDVNGDGLTDFALHATLATLDPLVSMDFHL